jgi:Fur family transcriptional regulator, ferric uptake regulator
MSNRDLLEERLDRHMAEHRLKQTRQRQVIFEAFLSLGDHVSIDRLLTEAQKHIAGLGYATVYRTMKLFTEAGVAVERRFSDGQTQYEPAVVGEHHDHLICRSCGTIFEFEDELIEERQRVVARRHGLRIVSHRLELYGECLDVERCTHRDAALAARGEA